jgi:hypothetical protein
MKALDRSVSRRRGSASLSSWERRFFEGEGAARYLSLRENRAARRLWASILKTVAQPGACRSRLEAVSSFLGD